MVMPEQGLIKIASVTQAIDASLGAYAALDVVGADDCCTTNAIPWKFKVSNTNGKSGYITKAELVNETENQAVRYDLLLFSATPHGELRDNANNTNPLKADMDIFIGVIPFQSSTAKGATVATYTQATPSTVGELPLHFQCNRGDKYIYGVLVTNTAYTQTATDDIKITLTIEPD